VEKHCGCQRWRNRLSVQKSCDLIALISDDCEQSEMKALFAFEGAELADCWRALVKTIINKITTKTAQL